jgi:sugar/nucleoside kinase (ribokinase family)
VKRAVICGTSALHVVSSARPTAGLSRGRVRLSPGGPAAVVALQLARLGRRPLFVGTVGADPPGDFVRTELIRSGVDCSAIQVGGRTPCVLAVVDDGVELTADVPDDAMELAVPPHLTAPGTVAGDMVYVTGFPELVPALRTLASAGHRPVVDVGYIPLLADPAGLIAYAEAIACDIGTAVVSGAALREGERTQLASVLLARGADLVLTTLGDQGVLVTSADGPTLLPPFAVTPADPLCAGDAFVAGYLCAVLEGAGAVAAANFGQAVAACKVSRFAEFPGRADVEQFIRSHEQAC